LVKLEESKGLIKVIKESLFKQEVPDCTILTGSASYACPLMLYPGLDRQMKHQLSIV